MGQYTPRAYTYPIQCRTESGDRPSARQADGVGLASRKGLVCIRRKHGTENDDVVWPDCTEEGQEMGGCGEDDGMVRSDR